jgi:hypothetical protein
MRSNLMLSIGLLISGFATISSSLQAKALDSVQEKTSVVEKTTLEGNPTVIQHIDSRMEPTVVQSRTTTDPETGEKQKVVEPVVMERHDKVLDTTIIQPGMTELTKTTKEVTNTQTSSPVTAVHRRTTVYKATTPHHFHVAKKKSSGVGRVAYASNHRTATSTVKQITETTEIERQPVVKETIIQNPPDNNPPAAPQVIQKTGAQ